MSSLRVYLNLTLALLWESRRPPLTQTNRTASAAAGEVTSKWLGLLAVVLASVNIFGGFAVTARMLAMYKKKERPVAAKK